jgi:DNA polymerase III subunit delta'
VARAVREACEARLADELQFLPRKEHKRRETEVGEQARRAERRAQTTALDHALQLAGLWYRDLACVAAGAPELAHHADRVAALADDAAGRAPEPLHAAIALVDDFRARLALNVSFDLALEALAFRLERTLR